MSPILGSRGISPRGYGFAGAGKPNAPTSVSATDVGTSRAYNNGAATVSFSSGGDNGSPITSYTVTSSPGGYTASGASSPLTVTGLQSGVSYTFTATATNSVGTSDNSSASSSITATTVPQAPTIGTATAGDTSATVTYTAGATGGKAVSTYTATSSPGSITGTGSSPITVSGLTNGTAYTFTVTATNANGTSIASSASNSITPAEAGDWDLIATSTSTSSSVTFSGLNTGTYNTYILKLYSTYSTSGYGPGDIGVSINGITSNTYRMRYLASFYSTTTENTQISSPTTGATRFYLPDAVAGVPSIAEFIITGAKQSATRYYTILGKGGAFYKANYGVSANYYQKGIGATTGTTDVISSITVHNSVAKTTVEYRLYGVK